MDGNAWCAVDRGFVDLATSPAGFGDDPEKAVLHLGREIHENLNLEDFETGGFCKQCSEWLADADSCPCGAAS